MAFTMLGIAVFFARPGKVKRRIFLVLVIAYMGFTKGAFISIALLLGWATGSASPLAAAGLGFLVLVSLALQSFKGPFYCYHLCPFGAAQELAGSIPVKKRTPVFLARGPLSHTRWALLAGAAFGAVALPGLDLSQVEPFTAFTPRAATPWVLGLALFFLALSIFIPRAWCRAFCPTGAFFSMFTKKRGRE